jgi:hypothetical protein
MRLREFIRHNLWLKIFAFALALLTWSTLRYMAKDAVVIQSEFSRLGKAEFSRLPVNTLAAFDENHTYHIEPSEVTVTVSGRGADLDKLSAQDILVFVNLAGIHGAHDLVRQIKVHCPPGIVVERIKPSIVMVNTILTNGPTGTNDQR